MFILLENLAPAALPRSGSLQAATNGNLKVAATSAIEIPNQQGMINGDPIGIQILKLLKKFAHGITGAKSQ